MIELIVFDVDGTLTDGKLIYSSNQEFKSFDVRDGLAIKAWTTYMNKTAAIITGKSSMIVENRANELNISEIHQGVSNKIKVLKEISSRLKIDKENIAVIGDDLNDIPMFQMANLKFCPQNAASEVKKHVDIVLEANGGNGAAREMIEYILKKDNLYEKFLSYWLNPK